jgi:hypothetical protein
MTTQAEPGCGLGIEPTPEDPRRNAIWPLVTAWVSNSARCQELCVPLYRVPPQTACPEPARGMAYVARVRPRADGGPSLCDPIV